MVLRDIIYTHNEIQGDPTLDLSKSETHDDRGVSISCAMRGTSPERGSEYRGAGVGTSIGLRGVPTTRRIRVPVRLRVWMRTGCGPGAMKATERRDDRACQAAYHWGCYPRPDRARHHCLAEPPNPIVNELVILPDIEKRLEAFVRVRARRGDLPRRGGAPPRSCCICWES